MADQPATAAAKGGGKKFAGVPVLYWAVGAAAVIGGYLYIRYRSSSSSSSPSSSTGDTNPQGTTTFTEFVTDQQSQPTTTPTPAQTQPAQTQPGPAPTKHKRRYEKITFRQAQRLHREGAVEYVRRGGRFTRLKGAPRRGEQLYTTPYELRHHQG